MRAAKYHRVCVPLVGCANLTTPNDVPLATGSGPMSPEATQTPGAATTLTAPTVVVLPGQEQVTVPSPADTFWAPNEPKSLPPQAFGPLPPDWHPDPYLTIGAYELKVPLPDAPPALDVYQDGDYPSNHLVTAGSRTIKDLKKWEFIPEYSLVLYDGPVPLGTKMPVTTTAHAEQQAMQVLRERGLLCLTLWSRPYGTRSMKHGRSFFSGASTRWWCTPTKPCRCSLTVMDRRGTLLGGGDRCLGAASIHSAPRQTHGSL